MKKANDNNFGQNLSSASYKNDHVNLENILSVSIAGNQSPQLPSRAEISHDISTPYFSLFPQNTYMNSPPSLTENSLIAGKNFLYTDFSDLNLEKCNLFKESLNEIKRKEKRAEKSRKARLKKKIYVQKLEEEVEILSKRLEKCRANFNTKRKPDKIDKIVSKRLKLDQQTAKEQVEEDIREMANTNKAEKECSTSVDSCTERLSQALYYLESVQDCILPGDQVKFMMWILSQKDSFYETEVPRNLFNTLDVPFAKIKKALSNRKPFKDDKEQLDALIVELNQLTEEIKSHLTSANGLLKKIKSIYSPKQIMCFCAWLKTAMCTRVKKDIEDSHIFNNPVVPPQDP